MRGAHPGCADDGDASDFGEELAIMRRRWLQWRPDGEFVLALGAARQEQDRDVAAADEQKRTDGRREEVEELCLEAARKIRRAAQIRRNLSGKRVGDAGQNSFEKRLQTRRQPALSHARRAALMDAPKVTLGVRVTFSGTLAYSRPHPI